jgi:hypothetical protein
MESKLRKVKANTVEERVFRNNDGHAIHRYTKGKFLGAGGFASCYVFTDQET